MPFGLVGSAGWDAAAQESYDARKTHPAVVAVLQRFNQILPGLEQEAERVLVACSLSFTGASEAEIRAHPSPVALLHDLLAGSWLPTLFTAIETAPLTDEAERRIMIGAYLIAESFIFYESTR